MVSPAAAAATANITSQIPVVVAAGTTLGVTKASLGMVEDIRGGRSRRRKPTRTRSRKSTRSRSRSKRRSPTKRKKDVFDIII